MVVADDFMAYLLDRESRGGSNMGCRGAADAQQV
jgi:hypothetical protein